MLDLSLVKLLRFNILKLIKLISIYYIIMKLLNFKIINYKLILFIFYLYKK